MNIRKIVKNNKILSSAAYLLRSIKNAERTNRFRSVPLDNRKVLFYRSGGGYGDNPKAVAEYLHAHFPDLKLVWATPNAKYLDSFPSYITPVIFGGDEYYRELASAGAWVCSTTMPYGTRKRPQQLYIQTWHGDKFLKKIGNDAASDVKDYRRSTASRKFCESQICDYYVTGCEWFVPIAASALDYKGAFLRCGMPRNDCLADPDETNCAEIRKRIGVEDGKKILIYAPTFRDYERSHDVIRTDIDLVRILDALEKKTGDEWVCLLRAHDGKCLTINDEKIPDPRFHDLTSYPDMAELLMVSDMLISDYSSCGADFAITGKMVLMYQDDYERFTAKGRTLYFSREESPYFTACSMEEALAIIYRETEKSIRENCRRILDFYDSFETGHASEAVSTVIMDSLSKIR